MTEAHGRPSRSGSKVVADRRRDRDRPPRRGADPAPARRGDARGRCARRGGRRDVARRALQWVIDPLDGTVNFLHGVPLFAVSIAAAVDGEVVAGAVVDVLRGELFSAHARRRGEPATLRRSRSPAARRSRRRSWPPGSRTVRTSGCGRPRSPTACSRTRRDLRCFGSAALELCWVACGARRRLLPARHRALGPRRRRADRGGGGRGRRATVPREPRPGRRRGAGDLRGPSARSCSVG